METIFDAHSERDRLARELLERIADKWTLLVVEALEDGAPKRFTRIQEQVGGISQKMLTKTLRQLERDGLITRQVYPVVPPRVDYQLTPRGQSFGEAACSIWHWVERHAEAVARSREAFAADHAAVSAPRTSAP